MVYEDTRQTVANGTIQQHGSHRAVDATTEAEYHPVLSQLLFQLGHGSIYKRRCTPLLLAATDVDHEVLQQLGALKGVEHLWVELDGKKW